MIRSPAITAWLALVVALACAAVSPLAAQASGDTATAHPRVERVIFHGVESVNEGLLRRSIVTRATTCRSPLMLPFCWISSAPVWKERHYLDPIELERDELRIRVFYFERGWRAAEVTAEVVPRDEDVVNVVFTVEEGEPTLVSALRVEQADSVLGRRAIERARLPAEGGPLDLVRLDSAVTFLQDRFAERGFLDATVDDSVAVDRAARLAEVDVALAPGRRSTVDTIEIRGNQKVEDHVIRVAMDLKKGQVLRRGRLLGSQRNLYESNLFRQVLVSVPPTPDSAKPVVVDVREAPLRALSAGAGFNTLDFVQVEAGYTHYDFLGGGRVLNVQGALGNLFASTLNGASIFHHVTPSHLSVVERDAFLRPTWQTTVTLQQPGFRSNQANTVTLTGFARRRIVPAIAVDHGFGASATFTRKLIEGTPASAGYRYEVTRVEAGGVYYCLNFGICAPTLVSVLQQNQRLSPLVLSVFSDRGNNPVTRTAGYTARFDAEHASALTLSDFRYNRASGAYARYFPLRDRRVLAAHARGGWVRSIASTGTAVGLGHPEDLLHPRTRFYAGGARSVRGYGENQLGPRVLTVAASALTDSTLAHPCTAATIADGACDPGDVASSKFDPRPLGGTRVVEGSLEYRRPVWGPIIGAVFVDAGWVGAGGSDILSGGRGAVTPGFGVRYNSPVGPIRVDLGIRPRLVERLPVVTEVVDGNGEHRLVLLSHLKEYDPIESSRSLYRQIVNRLTLHLSIGEAF
ncbi:MAG TPA: BamA/TamA family outer membrane protein [Longimicrobiaceae bacterium]|jgi:outer membrane protein insertion porin family/translocation and assembly module TamA|nr:BamA/TamA family outer membrane protein [Longimicrobiaceae bacterium]